MRTDRNSGRARGFTLLELIIVVAIVAILSSVAIFATVRRSEALTIEAASGFLQSRIERAQSLASVAGARAGTAQLLFEPSCHQEANDPQLWIRLNPATGVVTYPARLAIAGGTGAVTVQCEDFDLQAKAKGLATFTAPTANLVFAFTADGRVIQPGGTNRSIFFQLVHTETARRAGWRVLASGVMCASTDPTRNTCDEDA